MFENEGSLHDDLDVNLTVATVWEGVGMYLFLTFSIGVVIQGTLTHDPHTLRNASVAFGVLLAMQVVAWGPKTGCHLNTYVTLCLFFAGKLSRRRLGYYAAVHMIAAFAAVFTLWGTYGSPGRNVAHLGAAVPSSQSGIWFQLLFGFVSVLYFGTFVLHAAADKRTPKAMVGPVIGAALGTAIYFSAKWSGGGVNLAREFAPLVVSGTFVWAPLVGGLLACPVAGYLYRLTSLASDTGKGM